MYGDFGHPIVAWRAGMAGLGDNGLLSLGFNSLQIQQINALHAAGALSDAGYNAIISGYVSPDDLVGFLDQDPGAPQQTSGNAVPTGIPGSPTAAPPLQIGPSPRVNYPSSSFSAWISGSSIINGLPNWAVLLGGLAIPLLVLPALSPTGRRR